MKQSESFFNSSCNDQIHLAEHELSAFVAAVSELFGAEEARVSAEDWLEESELMEISRRSTRRDWRAVTIAASVRLANRLNVVLHRQTSLTWTPDTQTAASAASLMIAVVIEDRASHGEAT